MYELLKGLFQSRRTPRLVDRNDINPTDVEKIKDVLQYAPSFDKVFPYETYFLTNTEAGKLKKEQLVEFFRCQHIDGTVPKYKDPWQDREMPQPILSGLTIAYVLTMRRSSVYSNYGTIERYAAGNRDVMISATYAMLAARSLGYQVGFFGSCLDRFEAAKLFNNDGTHSLLVTLVTVANSVIPNTPLKTFRQYFKYKNQTSFVFPLKHRSLPNFSNITVI